MKWIVLEQTEVMGTAKEECAGNAELMELMVFILADCRFDERRSWVWAQ